MSTVPVAAVPPGLMPLALRTACAPGLLFSIDSVPAANSLSGFADEAVKLAPGATKAPTAAKSTTRAPSVRLGCLMRNAIRATGFLHEVRVRFAFGGPADSLLESRDFADPPHDGGAFSCAMTLGQGSTRRRAH